MADLPKIVRQRLQQKPGEVHPDADLLTAFAERALGERERAQVLDHLAACVTCREVVALARPLEEAEGEQAAAAPQGLRGWVLRWQTAAALATVAIAAVALLTIPDSYFRSARAPVQVAKSPAEKSATTRGETAQPAGAPATPAASRQQAGSENGLAPRKREAVAGGGLGGGVPAVLAQADRGRRDESKDKLSRGLPPPPPEEGQVTALTAEAPKQGTPPATRDFKISEKAPAAPTSKPQIAGGAAAAPGVAQPQSEAVKVASAPVAADQARAANETVEVSIPTAMPALQWRTSPAGHLQRSPDAGRSWRTVTVSSGAVWNAVSAVGERVWVGGQQQHAAILYYSADSGAHWARLEFTAPAGAQAANIVALNFTDVLHGVMTVVAAQDPSLRQIWTTADGGHTWTGPPAH